VVLLVVTLAAWWYVATTPTYTCKMPGTPICYPNPHTVTFQDWTLAVVSVGTIGMLAIVLLRGRTDGRGDETASSGQS
jgi:hypothetical protein